MPRLKPPAAARRVPAFRPPRASVLTDAAIEALFRNAEVLIEGALADEGGEARFYGSVMITVDLDAMRSACRGLEGDRAIAELVEATAGSVRVRIRVHRLARRALRERFPDREVGTAILESTFSRAGPSLLVDIDLEAAVGLSSVLGQSR
ncbi:MAG: hypothetical protein ACFCGT_16070 [Sandaracinaceae bacterium]